MKYTIIDAHAHLWSHQNTEVEGQLIQSLKGGKSLFFGEERQMMPPYMLDGHNSAEMFISNMNYAQVSAAVVTQEYIDGNQNDYLLKAVTNYPNRLVVCGLAEFRKPGYFEQVKEMSAQGFRAVKIPAQRLITSAGRVWLTEPEMMEMFNFMEQNKMILSIDLADGTTQVAEMKEVINECPNLKIAIGHFGMVTRTDWKEQIKLACHPNVRIESGGITWLFHQEFYPYPSAIRAIKEAAEIAGIEKLMWGSDYPRTMTAITYRMSYDFVLKSNELAEYEKAAFLGKNAISFYGLSNLIELPYIKNMVED